MADQVTVGKEAIKSRGLKFVVLIGVVSFFADFTYEGARSITGPYLAILGASATLVGFIAGFGELLGYGLRLVSGRLSERTGEFWPITLFGPLVVAAVLAARGNYKTAFAILLVPAIVTLLLLVFARFSYPTPEDLEVSVSNVEASGLPPVFWIYLVGAGLVAAGFADFSLMAYHFEKASVIPNIWVPVFYSVAMGVSGIGSLLF